MSLQDTAFIFVVALIIFGPKKLPEIGRQIGRLVGEFRRASNEFKFQIEEELRQAERADSQKTQPSIEPPKDTASLSGSSYGSTYSNEEVSTEDASTSDESILAESIAPGQHPNVDAINASANQLDGKIFAESSLPVSLATITAAVGSQPRTAIPNAQAEPAPEPANESASASPSQLTGDEYASGNPLRAPLKEQAANHEAATAEAEITHG